MPQMQQQFGPESQTCKVVSNQHLPDEATCTEVMKNSPGNDSWHVAVYQRSGRTRACRSQVVHSWINPHVNPHLLSTLAQSAKFSAKAETALTC